MTQLANKNEIKNWLESMSINLAQCIIHDDLTVDVNKDVNLDGKLGELKELPIQFGVVKGSFYIQYNQLTTLKGSPHTIEKDFICHNNQLSNLEGAPQLIPGAFKCAVNQLTSLTGGPQIVKGQFYDCSINQLKNLKGVAQEIAQLLDASSNQLISLEGINAKFNQELDISFNQLKTLNHCPKKLDRLICYQNQLNSLEGIGKIKKELDCSHNELTTLKHLPLSTSLEQLYANDNELTHLEGCPQKVGKFNFSSNPLINLEHIPQEIKETCILENIQEVNFEYCQQKSMLMRFAKVDEKAFEKLHFLNAHLIEFYETPMLTDTHCHALINFFNSNKKSDIIFYKLTSDETTQDNVAAGVVFLNSINYLNDPRIKAYVEKQTLESTILPKNNQTNRKVKI